ncbi:unnamed protein product, partial [Callosobruchus maculatus]
MLIISRINKINSISQIQSYSKILFGRTVLNNNYYLPECRTIRNYTKLRSTHSRQAILNTRKTINSYGYATVAAL